MNNEIPDPIGPLLAAPDKLSHNETKIICNFFNVVLFTQYDFKMGKSMRVILLIMILVPFFGCDNENLNTNPAPAPGEPLSVEAGNTIKISPEGKSFADPEILNFGHSKVIFQDKYERIWLADLDPLTGEFISETGEELLIDTGGESLIITHNGPEFGVNKDSWSVFYAKNTDGDTQLWKAQVSDANEVTNTQLTFGSAHMTPILQQTQTLNFNRVLYINGTWDSGYMAWLQDDPLTVDHNIIPIESKSTSHPTWIEDTEDLIFRDTTPESYGQLAFYNSITGEKKVITNDDGDKSFPFAWKSPEHNNQLVAMALYDDTDDGVVNKTSIVLYKDNGGDYWERISKLDIPAESGGITLGSPEPFISNGKSYLSLSMQLNYSSKPGVADAQIWIFGIDDNPNTRVAFRCDDGQGGLQMRMDPETLKGSEQFFVYYNILTTDGFEIYRCATGLRTN